MKRIVSLVMALFLAVTMLPAGELQAAAKVPSVAASTVVPLNGVKSLAIVKNGYTITKIVSVKSSKASVAKATASKTKLTIYGIKAGSAKITVKAQAKKGKTTKTYTLSTKATVKNPTASLGKKTLRIGESTAVKTANVASGAKVTYKSSNTSVASVSAKGVVTAKAGGSAVIRVTVVLKKTKYAKQCTKTLNAGTVKVTFKADEILKKMSTEEKLAQMMMPAFRQWDGENVTDLAEAPGLAEMLQEHQYGGVILFGQNVKSTGQTVRLISDLQSNNAQSADAVRKGGAGVIPYLVSADVEGGRVNRLTTGTRGTGSTAIGATGEQAEENARKAGQVFGEEMAALGINVNLAPLLDVVLAPTDEGMCNRVFSDDAETNAKLGTAFGNALKKNNVITTYKHFPGAGDGSDDPTAVQLTREELDKTGLKAYQQAIDNGMEMLMVSAVTFPKIDEKQKMADGKTEGYYPASASKRIVDGILRKEMGYDGVVMTDALEMAQFVVEPETGAQLFPGDANSVEHGIAVSEACINAGCDILLIPTAGILSSEDYADYMNRQIAGLAKLVGKTIDAKRLDESVRRILLLKEKRGVLDMDVSGAGLYNRITSASKIVGSAEHHAVEEETAKQAVTLLKNDGVIPVDAKASSQAEAKKIVFVGNAKNAAIPINYALKQLKKSGDLDPNAKIEDLTGSTTQAPGSADSRIRIVIDSYGESLKQSIAGADLVICLSVTNVAPDAVKDSATGIKGAEDAMQYAKDAKAKFIFLSAGLPTDTARFAAKDQADAIVCAYMGAGFATDPEVHTTGSKNPGAYNATVPAAITSIFGGADFPGQLPIDIHKVSKNADGKWEFEDELLYRRGDSLVKNEPEMILHSMSTIEKVEQMIMPALRSYDGVNTTSLSADQREFLQKHGFGGVILFAQNVQSTEQTIHLIDELQTANAGKTQLLLAVDQEGGVVTRLTTGTQMIGNMALAATGSTANASQAGSIIGSELEAIGFNTDFAPVVDVNNNPKNPVIGVRSFSDDPQMVSEYGKAFAAGLKENGITATLKHFPGHGDTSTDTHTSFTVVDKTYDQLKKNELVPFQALIDDGADMIMTAHIQYPKIETETYTAKDGSTITLPATLSKKILTDILRGDMGYEGVICTDALEMGAIANYFDKLDAARLAINAGADILLIPYDITSSANIDEFTEYMNGIAAMVENGQIDPKKVDAAVLRILKLKQKKNLLYGYESRTAEEIASDKALVGSAEHHDAEWEMAKDAITLVKNDNALPIDAAAGKTAVLYPELASNPKELSVTYAVNRLKAEGKVPSDAEIISINYNKTAPDEIKTRIRDAKNVIILSSLRSSAWTPKEGNDAALIDDLIATIHENGAKAIFISGGLPYNAARFSACDAILLTYSDKGMKELPGTRAGEILEYGPNIPAAVYLAFTRDESPSGKLPVNIPALKDDYSFADQTLYKRGFGLNY